MVNCKLVVVQGIQLVQLLTGDEDDDDEVKPLKLRETKKLHHRPVLQLELGGQHVVLLAGEADESD